jgi:hypothetical protein
MRQRGSVKINLEFGVRSKNEWRVGKVWLIEQLPIRSKVSRPKFKIRYGINQEPVGFDMTLTKIPG